MIQQAVTISLMILAIYILFQQGMLLGWLRIIWADAFDLCFSPKWSRYLQKPLWDCLTCMSSVWTLIITRSFNLKLILVVCGINAILDAIFDFER